MVAQFDAMDGGERSANNLNYYFGLGMSDGNGNNAQSVGTPTGSTKLMFYANGNTLWTPKVGFSSAQFYFGGRINVGSLSAASSISCRNLGGSAQIELNIETDGSIGISSGANVLARSGPGVININTNQYVEIFGVVSATVGQVQVRLNGNPTALLNVSNVNTANDLTSLPVTSFQFHSSYLNFYLRDLYVHDGTGASPFNSFLGNGGCEWLPVASLVSEQFTAVGGTNLSNAASTPPNPTVDYNESSTVGQLDKFGITALPSNVASVIAVAAVDYSYKSDTGPRALQKTLYSGSSTVVGTENYLNESPTCNQDAWQVVDPATTAAWLNAAVNAINVSYAVAA